MEGCGNSSCANKDCASSGHFPQPLTRNEAAAKALELFKSKAALCERAPCKVVKRDEDETDSGAGVSGTARVASPPKKKGTIAVRPAVVLTTDDLECDSGDAAPSVTKKTKPDPPGENLICFQTFNFHPLIVCLALFLIY